MEESSLEYGAGKNGKTVKAPALISESEPNLAF
jgi:hypothetical protein